MIDKRSIRTKPVFPVPWLVLVWGVFAYCWLVISVQTQTEQWPVNNTPRPRCTATFRHIGQTGNPATLRLPNKQAEWLIHGIVYCIKPHSEYHYYLSQTRKHNKLIILDLNQSINLYCKIQLSESNWNNMEWYFNTRIRSVECGICPIAAVCTVLLCCHGHVTLAMPTFWKHLSGVMSGLSRGTRLPNLKLYLQPFWRYYHLRPQNYGVTWPWPRPLFGNICHGSCRDQNLRRHVTVTTPTFRKYLSGVMWRLSLKTPAKFEVCIFSHFGAISI